MKIFKVKKIIITFVVLILAILMIGIIILSLTKRDKKSCFSEQELFFVYTEKNTKQEILEVSADKIKSLGGAGKIIFYNNNYYLVSSLYFDKKDAEEVVGNISSNFPESGVLTLKVEKTKKPIKKAIKQDDKSLAFYEFFYEACNKSQGYMIDYMSRTLSQSELSMNILKDKLNLEEMIKSLDKKTNLSQQFFNYMNMINLYYDNFLSSFFESTKKESLISGLVVELSLLRLEMVKHL